MHQPRREALARSSSSSVLAALAILASALAGCGSRSPAPGSDLASSQRYPLLGTSESFAVLGGQTVTNTGPTVVNGDLGVDPGSAVTGFPPGLVLGGVIHAADAVALQAQSDETTAYLSLAGRSCGRDLTGQDLAGLTLTAGVYCFSSSAQLSGALTLDAQGNPNALFVFQIGSTLTTASNAHVFVINGGRECNVFWQVGSSATVGTTTDFVGSILALTSISLQTGANLAGRALAQNGAVTMDTNHVAFESCAESSDGGSGGGTGDGGAACAGTLCGCACVDVKTDAKNCGLCGLQCGEGFLCTGGSCVPECTGSLSPCGGACVDLLTSPNNCGECGNICQPNVPCSAGYCGTCPGTVCASWCVDLMSDRHDCGSCGHACTSNETCTSGACVRCAGTVCGRACVDLGSDSKNCGACGVACATSQTCTGGVCGQSCGAP